MIYMINKRGITVTVMVITVILLIIVAGTITFSMNSTISYSRLSSWANEIEYIQEVVNEQLNGSSNTEFSLGYIIINTDKAFEANEQFEGEALEQDKTLILRVLNLGKLGITNTMYGNLDTTTDVYAVSETTGRVYYVQGIDVDGQKYYTLTNALRNRFNLNTVQGNLTSIVFVPSSIGYSNTPIKVTVKVPNTYTNIVIRTSNEQIQIGSQIVKQNTYEYQVNENNIAGNYTVTVSYNDGTKPLVSEYKINGYDTTEPVIKELTDSNFMYKRTETGKVEYLIDLEATDESGIKVMKYTTGIIAKEQAKEYFEQNTNIIKDGTINLDRKTSEYTIYVEDNAGNFSILTFDKNDYQGSGYANFVVTAENRAKIGYSGNENETLIIPTTFVDEDNVVYKVTGIGANAFEGCANLTNVTIPESVTSIGTYAFSECTSMQTITLPNSINNIASFAFNMCTSLQSISIPEAVTTIKYSVFRDCGALK